MTGLIILAVLVLGAGYALHEKETRVSRHWLRTFKGSRPDTRRDTVEWNWQTWDRKW